MPNLSSQIWYENALKISSQVLERVGFSRTFLSFDFFGKEKDHSTVSLKCWKGRCFRGEEGGEKEVRGKEKNNEKKGKVEWRM